MPSLSIAERIATIRATLPESVRLIAITKQVAPEVMREAYAAGIRDFGESRIQEAETKQQELADLQDITWHLIGHLQSNKAQKALSLFSWIHSVDSLALAQRLDRLASSLAQPPHVCLQVKIVPDPNKFGWGVDDLLNDLPQLDECKSLNIIGLMAIPPLSLSDAETLQVFQQTQVLANKINQQGWSHIQLKELSMGMSGDYPLAIQAGATLIRLGRTLFGERTT